MNCRGVMRVKRYHQRFETISLSFPVFLLITVKKRFVVNLLMFNI